MFYTKKLLRRFQRPKFVGIIKNANVVAEEGNIICGDKMKIFLKIKEGIIREAKFQTYGCPAAIACADVVCELVKGKKINQAINLKPQDIVKKIGNLPPIKYHCSLLGIQTLKKAIKKYLQKDDKEK